jgi:hypothetical protein
MENLIQTRSELIKRAREDCSRNLDGHFSNSKKTIVRDTVFAQDKDASVLIKRKMLIIRTVCAIIIFLLFIAMDQFQINYNGIESNKIKDVISSTYAVENLEKKITEITVEKIIPVFNGLH